MKKLIISSIVALLSSSCSVLIPNNSTQKNSSPSPFTLHPSPQTPLLGGAVVGSLHPSLNFSDLEKEYKSFSTKALSDAYVSRMFNKFLTTSPNPTQVIRQLEFARYMKDIKSDSSYFDSLKSFIADDSSKFTQIDTTNGVPAKKTAESATFGAFVNSLNPNQNSIVTSGLLLNLDAGNVASYSGTGTIWNDLSGNGDNGTLLNGVSYSSADGGFFTFDGVNDYVDLPPTPSTGDSYTVCGFIKILSFNGDFKGLFYVGGNLTSADQRIDIHGGNINFMSYGTIAGSNLSVTGLITNQWYSVAFVRDQSASKLLAYVNGQLKNSVNLLSGSHAKYDPETTQKRFIGTNSVGYSNVQISTVQLYNRALSQSEVLQGFNAFRLRYGL